MLHLLDANVLIDAARDYYPVDMVPEFWDWLCHQGTKGAVKIPLETLEEVCEGRDPAADWLRDEVVKDVMRFSEEPDPSLVARVVTEGYAADLTDDEIVRIGRDPFLIAYALVAPVDRCVVTTEGSKPTKTRANRKVPDVCSTFQVQCCNTFDFVRRLGFRTRWQTP
jgi:hypothetical protein